ncbi:MAG TPA: hypothetical protein VGH44_00320 [Candidatus Saccharimonadia bacterium]|jgi:hypothetical protein
MTGASAADVPDRRARGHAKLMTKFFPADRERFYTDRNVEVFVFEPLQVVVTMLADRGLLNRNAGHLIIRWLRTGHELPFDIGSDWPSPFGEVANAKRRLDDGVMPWVLSGPVGPLSRYAQMLGTTLLTGEDVVHFGTYAEDGIAIEYSGVQAPGDEMICRNAFTLLKGLNDLRKVMLDQVRAAKDFRYYIQAMDEIERVAYEFGFTDIKDAVARIVDDATLHRTRQIVQERALAGEGAKAMEMAGLNLPHIRTNSD